MIRLYAAAGVFVALVAAFMMVRYVGVLSTREKQAKAALVDYQNQAKAAYEASKALEQELADIRRQYDKINKDLQNETKANPVYGECRVPANGLRILQQAVAASR